MSKYQILKAINKILNFYYIKAIVNKMILIKFINVNQPQKLHVEFSMIRD
jgi:hypothetical protein